MSRLLVIDTSYLIYRSYFAYPDLINKGRPVGALYGFAKTIIGLLKDYNPEYLVFALDLPKPTWRHQLKPDYKAGRPKPDQAMVEQIPWIQDWAKKVSGNILSLEGFEADDIVHTLSLDKKPENQFFTSGFPAFQEILVFSSDRDLYQTFTNPKIKFLKPDFRGSRVNLFTAKDFTRKYGVEPSQWLDYKALVGDTGDNLPGLSGVGPKTAEKVLKDIKHLACLAEALDLEASEFETSLTQNQDSLQSFIQNPKNAKFITNFTTNLETVKSTYVLAKLQKVPGMNLNPKKPDLSAGAEIFAEFGFQSLLKNIEFNSQNSLF